MMGIIKNIFIAIGISSIMIGIQYILKSTYIIDFLAQNLIILLIALLAINLTTLSIVLTKIREIMDINNYDNNTFQATKKELLFSIKEQVTLIFISLILFTIMKSTYIKSLADYKVIPEILITSCFVYAIMILYDTARSIFIIIDFRQ